jgi:hypothetical protein
VHHLIVALLQFAVNVDVLDIETGQVLEDFILWPSLDVLNTLLVLLRWHCFDLDLLLQVVHRVC